MRVGSIGAVEPGSEQSRVDAWRQLVDARHATLVEAAAGVVAEGVTPASVMRLRRRFPDGPVTEALELAEARARAIEKFPMSGRMLMDKAGLEQATAFEVSSWKASRFGDRPVLDLCCGIGGDAMALADRGPCVAVDRDPVRAFMTSHNAGVETRVTDVEACRIDSPFVHLDPARRDEGTGRRSWRFEDLQPDLETIRRILATAEGGAVKLGPGIPVSETHLHERQSITVVAHRGRLVQAIVWTGALAAVADVEAVDLPSGRSFRGAVRSLPGSTRGDVLGEVLVEFHPALERVGLSGTLLEAHRDVLDWTEPASGLGLVSGTAIASLPPSVGDWCSVHRIREVCPARLDAVQAAIDSLPDATERRVVVRTRANAVDADGWTRALNSTPRSNVFMAVEVFGLRLGRRKVAVVCLDEAGDQSPAS